MSKLTSPAAAPAADPALDFIPVALRPRHDGWTPARQVAFIHALASTACVDEACRAVGITVQAAYALRRRPDAASFRQAWDVALDFAVSRVADAALGRALHGVATPVFYKGEQIGERRRFNEQLTMFILRYRQPDRYGIWLDDMSAKEVHPDGAAMRLTEAVRRLAEDGAADIAQHPRPTRAPLRTVLRADDPAEIEALELAKDRAIEARNEADWERYVETIGEETRAHPIGNSKGDAS